MTDDEKGIDEFFRKHISGLKHAILTDGSEKGNQFTFQYAGKDLPVTLSQATATRGSDGKITLTNFTKALSVKSDGGRVGQRTVLSSFGSFDDAFSALQKRADE